MLIRNGIIEAIGNTPLIKLKRASEETGCTILGKAEFMNPGQSVKDRAALFIIRDALKSGRLKPGGTVVEGTAGNTGIGLALVGNALGLKTVIVIPDTQSDEKKQMLRLTGAELIEVPAVPYKDPNNYVKYSGRLAEELAATEPKGAVWANQFDNVANRQGHIETTAQEIWDDTQGKVDGFICAVGTGGTLAGVSMGLKAKNPGVTIGLADPMGAALYNYYKHGVLKAEGSSITEGIGQGRITANLEGAVIDEAYQIPDAEALPILFDLLSEEGLCLGGSSGINVAGAIRLARDMGPGHTIVTVLADYGTRYQSRLFNPKFLREKGLPVPEWLDDPRAPRRRLCSSRLGLRDDRFLQDLADRDRRADARARGARPRHRRRLLAHAERRQGRTQGISRGAYSGRRLLRHRRDRRHQEPACRICCRRRRNSPRACAAWASATARASWSTTAKGLYSAARVWWTFRVMGVQDVSVLNGGLPKWKREGRPLESGEPEGPHRAPLHLPPQRRPRARPCRHEGAHQRRFGRDRRCPRARPLRRARAGAAARLALRPHPRCPQPQLR